MRLENPGGQITRAIGDLVARPSRNSECDPRSSEGEAQHGQIRMSPDVTSVRETSKFVEGISSRAADRADGAFGSSSGPGPDDLAVLQRFVEALLTRLSDGAKPTVRMVLRGGRLIELRVEPETAAALCGGSDAMRVLVRRWVELRWVRRVRPVLVLERRAIEAATRAVSRQAASEHHRLE